jgi:uncharacterized membrane protein YhaH (DUF805 family)
MRSYFLALSKYAEFSGRASRTDFWMFQLINIVLLLVTGLVDAIHGTPLSILYIAATICPNLAVGVRRLHDTGRSGWWELLSFIPIAWFVWLVFQVQDTQQRTNRYGPNPKTVRFGRTGRNKRLHRMPPDHPDLQSIGPASEPRDHMPQGSEATQLLPESILGSWHADGAKGSVELVFSSSDFLLVRDALDGVSSGPYNVVSGPDPAFEVEFPESRPVDRVWVKILEDGRLHVRGLDFEWVLERATGDRVKDLGRAVRDGLGRR